MIALDASALLAFLFAEPGQEHVGAVLDQSCMSAVNLAEVASRFARDGHDPGALLARIAGAGIEIVAFLEEDAALVAALSSLTQVQGLSLGDRACLALAIARDIPAMTADRAWTRLEIAVPIQCIRGPSRG